MILRTTLKLSCYTCRKCAVFLHNDGERHRSGGGVWGAPRQQLPGRGWGPVPVWLQHCEPGPGLVQHPGGRVPAGERGPTAGHATTVCSHHLLCQHEELPWLRAHADAAHVPGWVQLTAFHLSGFFLCKEAYLKLCYSFASINHHFGQRASSSHC